MVYYIQIANKQDDNSYKMNKKVIKADFSSLEALKERCDTKYATNETIIIICADRRCLTQLASKKNLENWRTK